ncbi:LysR family transcriptional regulator [Paenibacillus rigui]|uniref:LysR family transcriptional regulator n=1 Tax=Paenibacillus rigui TaxID=554312 RepID=A0A229UPV4_9BACL|nr:LysR family transcriptional regulator [Paenibacillus rigui]OXM85577.1 LysR family transcriptional regulator [Paenibacillus rigui]
MDLRQLRYFLAVAQVGQVTGAAKLLNMEQPPLSRQIKQMEQELQVTLFDRSDKRWKLTPAGEVLRERAEALLLQFEETLQEVKELDEGIQGMLAIGAVVSCISLLPKQIQKFREIYPKVTFKIQEGDHFLLSRLMDKRYVELVVARLPFEASTDEGNYSILRLPSDPFVAIIPAQWSKAVNQHTVTMQELAAFPFLTLKTDYTTGMHERVLNEFRKAGMEPQILCECSSVAIILAMVAAGIGATILPKSVMSSFPLTNIKMLDMRNADFYSDVGIVWLKDRYLSKNAQHFIEMFQQ